MTNKIICPFCGKDMEITMFARGREFVSCNNADCIISDWGGCSKQIITELIRTRKALGVAKDALKSAHDYYEHCDIRDKDGDDVNWDCTALNMELDISKALKQINNKESK